ncbi:MAG: DEAD/DEAH box helicase [Verrucomicrobiales bacterium]|nr:DEAD/DEAH box helicase [Verrucomicrobiales bacterium]
MPRGRKNSGTPIIRSSAAAARYDAHHNVLGRAYGALADLRRELSDSKSAVAERTEILNQFATCADPQRAWLLLEDYFEKLSLSRRDFPGDEWWIRLMNAQGKGRLEETAHLFLRANRALPNELLGHANFERFAQQQQAERDQQMVNEMERWLFPPAPDHLDSPRAGLRLLCEARRGDNTEGLSRLAISFNIVRSRTGEKDRTLQEVIELTLRATQEQELFPPEDWDLIRWLAENYRTREASTDPLLIDGVELLRWLVRWGRLERMLAASDQQPLKFRGRLARFVYALDNGNHELSLAHSLETPEAKFALSDAHFFAGELPLVLVGGEFFLLENPPSPRLLGGLLEKPVLPIRKLSHRLLTQLRRAHAQKDQRWDSLCVTHKARPQFIFELSDEVVRLRLMAASERDNSIWQWNGHEWIFAGQGTRRSEKPDLLDDLRLDGAISWLRKLDWFTPEPGLWVGDANENFLGTLSLVWGSKPEGAEFLGNPAFQRLFLQPRKLKPKLLVKGSGIDWLSVSAEWEQEGMKLSAADLQRLATATSRYVKLPDAGWVELDTEAVTQAHETMAELGVDGLVPIAQKVDMVQAKALDDNALQKFGDSPEARALRQRLTNFKGVPDTDLPTGVNAEMRPYQKDGFDFLCHLHNVKLGGILADDMGLGKTLQTLTWLLWLKQKHGKRSKPVLVICPASVLHNWRREAEKFTPAMRVLVLESGYLRHQLRKQIPNFDIVVTNYALLRRDLEELQKFEFQALVLDEAQFIKNPGAQVTQCVKQLKAQTRLALTGTPLENRLLDLWSIVDFIQPNYLGTQVDFNETYEAPREDAAGQRINRRRLSAKLRPLMLRRLKQQVAKDLPDRIEERRDCDLGEEQRKLYLAELRRSRDQVMQALQTKGLAQSRMHVLAALTRLRQICCHPQLVGSDTASGKTETLFELLEPLMEKGEKVLVFSQFVEMLKLLEKECGTRSIVTHILTGNTKDRQEVVRQFQEETRPAVFLLSLRAAGTGLNLTTASYVILYDPWWNPAVEAQAIDRSHRIGQTRTVNAYRLISPGTVEEKIWDLQQKKAQTISDVLGEEGFARNLSSTDLEYLFSED